jgi:hypothetical protein
MNSEEMLHTVVGFRSVEPWWRDDPAAFTLNAFVADKDSWCEDVPHLKVETDERPQDRHCGHASPDSVKRAPRSLPV